MTEATTLPRRQLAHLVTLGALLGAGTALGQAPKAKEGAKQAAGPADALKAVIEEHNKAFAAQDIPGVLKVFTPDALMLGTAPGEIWGGRDEIADAYKHFIADFDPGKQEFENLWWDAGVRGDTAWLLASGKVTMTKGQKQRDFGINTSITFEKRDGKWLVRTLHFSNLAGGPPPEPAKKG